MRGARSRSRNSVKNLFSKSIGLPLVFLIAGARVTPAQTGYYNLDSGRPTRIEDAVATPLGELEAQLLPLRGEWVSDGTQRVRYEPKLSFGVLPLTEIELRVPVVHTRSPATAPSTGIASAGIGALHAFNVETTWPAFALAAEAVLPVGSLSASTGSFSVKGLMTKTFPFMRLQVNVAGGTWSIRPTPISPVSGGGTLCGNAPGVPPCLIPDVPCTLIPTGLSAAPSFACMPSTFTTASAGAGAAPTTGAHWMAALGIDHAWPLISTLAVADIVIDRFDGLYPLDDWTAELGLRRQVAPQLVFDFGVSRRFAGTTQSTSLTVGLSYSMSMRRGF
jgi:hypothetical protein